MGLFNRSKKQVKLYEPLVRPFQHPVKFIRNVIILVALTAIVTHIAVLGWWHLYDLIFESNAKVTALWHNVPAWLRHDLRDGGELMLASACAQLLVWNTFKVRKQRRWMHWLDWLEGKLHIANIHHQVENGLSKWQYAAMFPVAVIYAIPGMLASALIINEITRFVAEHHHALHTAVSVAAASHHPIAAVGAHVMATHINLLQSAANLWTDSWHYKIIGLAGSIVLMRRPMRAYYQAIHYSLARRRVTRRGTKAPMWCPPPYRALVNKLLAEGVHA